MSGAYICPWCVAESERPRHKLKPVCLWCGDQTGRDCPACSCPGCQLARSYEEGEPAAFPPYDQQQEGAGNSGSLDDWPGA